MSDRDAVGSRVSITHDTIVDDISVNDTIVTLDPNFEQLSASGKVEPVRHLVLILHGILSISSRWQELGSFEGKFEDLEIIARPVSYKYMGPFDLIIGFGREKRANLVSLRIEKVIKDMDGRYDQLSIVCHSNGTKVFSDIPNQTKSRFNWIFFAGCICHADDDQKFSECIDNVINDCGVRDFLPIVAASLRPDIFGHTGVVGFQNPPFRDRFFDYGHSQAVSVDHFRDWIIPILRTGKISLTDMGCPIKKLSRPTHLRIILVVVLVITSFLALA